MYGTHFVSKSLPGSLSLLITIQKSIHHSEGFLGNAHTISTLPIGLAMGDYGPLKLQVNEKTNILVVRSCFTQMIIVFYYYYYY